MFRLLYSIFVIIIAIYTGSYAVCVFKKYSRAGGILTGLVTAVMLCLAVYFQFTT